MPTQRLTISLPQDTYADLKELVPAGEVSKFVAETIKNTLQKIKLRKKESFVETVMRLRETGPKYTTEEILDFIDRGRT